MYNKIILLIFFSILFSVQVFSQEENNEDSDTTDVWNWEDFKLELKKFHREGQPTINFNYGFPKISLNDLNSTFAKPNMIELRLGHTTENSVAEGKILKYRFTNLLVSYISTKLSNKTELDGLRSNLWRFGASWSNGYGYNLGFSSIIFFNSSSLDWSRISLEDFPADNKEKEQLERFNDAFRFGTSTEGGIRFKFTHFAAIEASYQRSIIFERHLFWKWAGGEIIYVGSIGLLDAFIHEIRDSSPYAAPVVSFVLKSALSYGIYELRHKKMNWPFTTAPPLEYDQFKFGLTFIF